MWTNLALFLALLCTLIREGTTIYCFECTSSQPGCGKDVDWKLQKWHWCTGFQGEPAMCVKYKELAGASERYVRGCVNTLLDNTIYRQEMPTIRRQNYCVTSKSDGNQILSLDKDVEAAPRVYCFCNEWDGCNHALGVQAKMLTVLILSLITLVYTWSRW